LAALAEPVAATSSLVVALDLASGKEKWRFQCAAGGFGSNLSAGSNVATALLKAIGGETNMLVALDWRTGKLRWQQVYKRPSEGSVQRPIMLENAVLVLGNNDDTPAILAYDPQSGDLMALQRFSKDAISSLSERRVRFSSGNFLTAEKNASSVTLSYMR
jgi:outer membrane protein assembly factor BamB